MKEQKKITLEVQKDREEGITKSWGVRKLDPKVPVNMLDNPNNQSSLRHLKQQDSVAMSLAVGQEENIGFYDSMRGLNNEEPDIHNLVDDPQTLKKA